ncbi:YheC/YheD family endospore coat-associated protein [Paenibacillus lactis]|uniref:YheC/YheD family endospore coat-associated protein n=1 Tax=Paenibacillus lactis TaxID=228574 RepID=UPI0036BD5689
MSSSINGTIGVMVCRRPGSPPFAEKHYLRELSLAAEKLGMKVFVFCPDEDAGLPLAQAAGNRAVSIKGYRFHPGDGWISGSFPLPDVIYDRCLHGSGQESAAAGEWISRLLQQGSKLWSRGLPGKAKVHQLLKRSPLLRPHLPATIRYTGADSLSRALLALNGSIFMKPSGGSHGRHSLYISLKENHTALLQGRDRSNTIFRQTIPAQELNTWVRSFTGRRRFIIQPYLQLHNQDGNPFDVRSLVQKNDRGIWSITGIAVRQGAEQGMTSNLHGGGTAYPALPYLISEFGEEKVRAIMDTIRNLSARIPPLLEEGFGRLGELGIDFGVDTRGKVWILEANSKPGRRAFVLTGDSKAARRSVEHPIQYARYLLLRQLRRVNT